MAGPRLAPPRLAGPRFAAPLAVGEQALFALTNLGLQVLLARSVPAEAFGAYTVASTFLFIAAVAHQTCLVEPMVVLGAGPLRDALAPYHARLLRRWSALIGLALLLLGLAAAAGAAWLGASDLARACAAFAVATPAILHLWLLRRIAFALGRVDLSAAATAIYAAATLALSVAALAFGRFGLGAAILAPAAAAAVASAALRARLRWPAAAAPPPDGLVARHLAYGRWALGAEAAAWALTNGPVLLAPLWLGLAAAGELRALGLAFMPLLQIASVASLLLLRRFAGEGVGVATRRRVFLLLGTGGALYTLAATALGPWLLPRLLGPDYALTPALLATAGLGATCLVAAQAFVTALRAETRTASVLAANLAALTVFAGLAPIAAAQGLLGVTLAQTLGAATSLLVAAGLANRRPALAPGRG
ncbi:MAG: hypothetical protein DI556_03520 [Rhodovulum sulfidophilum]|uniref:Polysaccharide biosynthesis protein n=1 Tax=Rhodovulum sulfidophilum TaxID=35806 RepID=A0A2W5NCM2_RHOSU|nr:MAG: hypothetical protein DI556_03520 [Rhodovulum sulfidophilum]